jgi:hypothetical protein
MVTLGVGTAVVDRALHVALELGKSVHDVADVGLHLSDGGLNTSEGGASPFVFLASVLVGLAHH